MLAKYGPMRVVDAPISECGFSGLGVGAAMVGMRPIVEFMTFSFSLVAFDQVVNNAPKMLAMSGGQLHVPIVFRGISGPGQQLSATHSWSVEALYTHVPGLKVVVPTSPADAKGLLKTAIRDDDPVIFLENEAMYGIKGEVPDGDFLIPFGQADIKREGKDCTVIAWGQGCITAMAAAEQLEKEHGIHVEVVDPRTLRPLDLPAIIKSVKKTGSCVTVETGYPTCGIGAELAALIHEHCFDDLDNHVIRVAAWMCRCLTANRCCSRWCPACSAWRMRLRKRFTLRVGDRKGGALTGSLAAFVLLDERFRREVPWFFGYNPEAVEFLRRPRHS